MHGGRITSEEKSAISTYVGAGIAVLLAVIGIYFFVLTQKEKKETTTFDPNRPVPSDTVLKGRLKAEEWSVVRENGSQTPFQNEFWNNEKVGIYVDVITLEPLFASVDKFDGKVGLPTFTKPISKDLLVEVPDNTNEMQRTQVRAKRSNARLGHVFPDPKSPTGQRYVVYSAAFHFVPIDQMKDRGYGAYLPLLDKK
jgi:peptide methionine sulfoxide reductase msrA/msrB